MGKTARLDFVDVAKGIAILLVLLGHLLMGDTMLKKWIYAFHMPFFFIASGFFISEKSFCEYATRRFYTLVIPYLVFAFFYCSLSLKTIPPILYSTNQSLRIGGSNGMLWFLPTLFLALLCVHLLKEKLRTHLWLSVIALMVLVYIGNLLNVLYHEVNFSFIRKWGLPFGVDIVLIGSAFCYVGYYLSYHGAIRWMTQLKRYQLAMLGLLLAVALLSVFYHTHKDYPQMATGDLGNWHLYFAVAVASSLGLLAMSQLLTYLIHAHMLIIMLIWLGKNSLTIFLIHRLFISFLHKNFIVHSSNFLTYVFCMIVLTLCSCICTLIINKYFPCVVGKTSLT